MSNHVSLSPGALMLDLEGPELSAAEQELLRCEQVGGLILFSRNYAEPGQLLELISSIREVRPELLIAVDQEGGRVQRFREGFSRLPPMARFHGLWKKEPARAQALAQECAWLMASELIAYDLDFSFAPVLDLDQGISTVIGDRAFGDDPGSVTALASAFIAGMHEAGMAATGKHFPGHGHVQADSHTEIPIDGRSLEAIREQDLQPFLRCARLLDAVMPAHVIYSQVDDRCAGFSRRWLGDILRGELGFEGVIFSDDLSMEGAASAGGIAERVDAALSAGCDMVLVCNDRPAALEALEHLEALTLTAPKGLSAMRRRSTLDPQALREDARYLRAKQALADLESGR